MKKGLIASILIVLFCIVFILCAKADESKVIEYTLTDDGLTISIPESLIVLTRNMNMNDPTFDLIGLDYAYIQNHLIQNNYYLDAFDRKFYYEILLIERESTTKDFSSLSDIWLSMYGSNVEKNYSEIGIGIQKTEIYTHGQLKYIKLFGTRDKSVFIEYITVINGKEIDVDILIDNTYISETDEKFCNNIINSLGYEDLFAEYKVNDLGVTISLPNDYDVQIKVKNEESLDDSDTIYFRAQNAKTGIDFNISFENERESYPISFSNLDINMANKFLPIYQKIYESIGNTVFEKKVTEYNGVKYLSYFMDTIHTKKTFQFAYITILKGKEMKFYFYPQKETYKTWNDAEKATQSIMESVVFDNYMKGNDNFANVHRFPGKFELMDGITFGLDKQELVRIEMEKYQSKEPYVFEATESFEYESVSFYGCKAETFENESRKYYLDKQGHMFYICLSLGLDENKNEILNKENYRKAYAILEGLYGKPNYKDDGYFFPLFSDELNRWTTSINCMEEYSQWLLEYDDYYVLAEIFQTKTTNNGIYSCYATYTCYEKTKVEPILGKWVKLY